MDANRWMIAVTALVWLMMAITIKFVAVEYLTQRKRLQTLERQYKEQAAELYHINARCALALDELQRANAYFTRQMVVSFSFGEVMAFLNPACTALRSALYDDPNIDGRVTDANA